MVSLSDSLVSSSARVLPIRVRTDLQAKRSQYLGRNYWVIKDPIGLKYYRFQDEENAILNMFDGYHSLDDIKERFEKEFPPQKITLEEIQNFMGMLHSSGLIIAGVPNQGHELLKRRKKKRRQELFAAYSNILCIRFKGFDLDWLLKAMLPYVRWFYHPVTVACFLCLMLCALSLVLVEFDQFRGRLPGFKQFFGPSNLFLLSLTLGVTKILHEFGHGLTAKYFGGECHEMGIMILVLTPCLYCNVSDSWMLPSKWHRIAIGIGGVYVECCLAAICTFLWWFSTPGLVNYICLNIMFISSVSTILFNINPLLRYDGYYILADLLEIPNLRQKATKIMTRKCSEWFLGMEQQDDPFLPQKNQLLFAVYSVAAVCYRWVITASILYFVHRVFKSYGLLILGQIIAAMSLYSLIVMPLWKVAKFFWVPGRIYKVKKKNFYISLAGLAILVACFFYVPLPYTVYVPMMTELRPDESSSRIYVSSVGGQLVQLNVAPGDTVEKGDVLAVLRNRELDLNIINTMGEIDQTKKRIALLKRLMILSGDGRSGANIEPLEKSVATAEKQLASLQKDYEKLTLRAPISGMVVSPDWRPARPSPGGRLPGWWGSPMEERNMNAFLEPNTHFCSVGDPQKMQAVLIVDQKRIEFVNLDQDVDIMLKEFPGHVIKGKVLELESRQMDRMPKQLSNKGGGDVPCTSEPDGTEIPAEPSYRVNVLIDNPDESIRIGTTGWAKIHVRPQTLFARAWRWVSDTFTFRL